MTLAWTNETLCSIISEIVVPLENLMLENPVVAEHFQTENEKIQHNFSIARFSIALFINPTGIKKLIGKVSEVCHRMGVSNEESYIYFNKFFELHKLWAIKHFGANIYYDDLMSRFKDMAHKVCSENKEEYNGVLDENEEDEFLMFESEEIDEAIDNMHYEDTQKMSAIDYLALEEITNEDLASILEAYEDSDDLIHKYNSLDEAYIVELLKLLGVLSSVLFSTYEFRDIGYALEEFSVKLKELDIPVLEDAQKHIGFELLQQMSKDIMNWIETMFIKKDAVDIHYFDASFLANIAQFGIMVEVHSEAESEDEDDFLF